MPTDPELRKRFAALQLADRAAAPEFDSVLGRPTRPHRSPRLAAVAAVAVVALAATIWLAMRRPWVTVAGRPTETPSILAWRSPTAALLHTPGLDLWGRVPTLGSSLLGDGSADTLSVHNPGA